MAAPLPHRSFHASRPGRKCDPRCWKCEPRGWDAYDAVRVAISAQLASGAGWSLGGYTYKIRAGLGQSV